MYWMGNKLYDDFLAGADTLRLYRGGKLVFASQKDGVRPLVEYLGSPNDGGGPLTVYDKVMGNAAALLAVKAQAREVYSPLGSEIGIETLNKYRITYHLEKIVPSIQRADGKGMCPMEQLSIGRAPEEFYSTLLKRLGRT